MLELRGIQAGYGRFPVLHELDLVVPEASAVALLGANGAGKTTLLKVAAGLLRPSGGQVLLDDRDVTSRPTYQRARRGVCLVPEGRGIFRQLTVRENLAMYAAGRQVGDAIERAVAAFPMLKERLAQVAGTLSGGQQQMLAVSRALVSDAPLIMADELSVGLAPVILDEIFEAVRQLRAAGRSLLIVEQYASRALAVTDYVYVLLKGRITFVGEPEQCGQSRLFEEYIGNVA